MQEDAAQLVSRFIATYKDCEENNAMAQLTEMFEYLVTENQHEILGVSPPSLQEILDLLRDKLGEVRIEYEELDTQKEQFKEIHLMREHCQQLEEQIETLQMFEQSFLESQNELKAKEKELAKAQEDV